MQRRVREPVILAILLISCRTVLPLRGLTCAFGTFNWLETERRGWVASTPVGDRIVHAMNNQYLVTFGVHTKVLPSSVVRAEVEKRVS